MSSSSTSNTASASGPEIVNDFTIPKWAGKPPSGLHLDVMKDGKMIQKLMIDEKRYYFFGRNKDSCDFQIDHGSCSRVHAVLIWHKHLNRPFLIDLGSTHGTFIGSIRLEHQKPQQVFIDNELKFGASTRTYIIRERPQINKSLPTSLLSNSESGENDDNDPNSSINSYALPESEAELDNLTEFNTAHNRRIAQLVDLNTANSSSSAIGPTTIKRKKKIVSFNEDEEVINPEDIDPSIGRFRNMIQTSIVIPNKKRLSGVIQQEPSKVTVKRLKTDDDDEEDEDDNEEYDPNKLFAAKNSSKEHDDDEDMFGSSAASNLGIKVLNLAPDVDAFAREAASVAAHNEQQAHAQMLLNRQQQLQKQAAMLSAEYAAAEAHDHLDKKKKYAKEAWPGRKHQSPGSSEFSITPSTAHSGSFQSPVSALSPPSIRPPTTQTISPPALPVASTSPSTTNMSSPPKVPPAQPASLPGNPSKRLII